MKKKAYIISFDKDGIFDLFNYTDFHNKLTTAKGVINWFHYLQTSYIIITENNVKASDISSFLLKIMPKKHFVVFEVNLNNYNGWLPQTAWDWIKKWNLETNGDNNPLI